MTEDVVCHSNRQSGVWGSLRLFLILTGVPHCSDWSVKLSLNVLEESSLQLLALRTKAEGSARNDIITICDWQVSLKVTAPGWTVKTENQSLYTRFGQGNQKQQPWRRRLCEQKWWKHQNITRWSTEVLQTEMKLSETASGTDPNLYWRCN